MTLPQTTFPDGQGLEATKKEKEKEKKTEKWRKQQMRRSANQNNTHLQSIFTCRRKHYYTVEKVEHLSIVLDKISSPTLSPMEGKMLRNIPLQEAIRRHPKCRSICGIMNKKFMEDNTGVQINISGNSCSEFLQVPDDTNIIEYVSRVFHNVTDALPVPTVPTGPMQEEVPEEAMYEVLDETVVQEVPQELELEEKAVPKVQEDVFCRQQQQARAIATRKHLHNLRTQRQTLKKEIQVLLATTLESRLMCHLDTIQNNAWKRLIFVRLSANSFNDIHEKKALKQRAYEPFLPLADLPL